MSNYKPTTEERFFYGPLWLRALLWAFVVALPILGSIEFIAW